MADLMTTRYRWRLAAAALVWIAAIGLGLRYLVNYSVQPGIPAAAPDEWPAESLIPAPQGQHVLVMTLHPHCPCSRASVTELNNLMAMLRPDHVKGYVLVVKPKEFADDWIQTESYRN